MLPFSSAQNYYLYRQPTDMRKSFNGLSGLVRSELGRNPLLGDVFIFINRRRDKLKLLVWDRRGLWFCTRAWSKALLNYLDLKKRIIRVV